jgi:hypothetical protein
LSRHAAIGTPMLPRPMTVTAAGGVMTSVFISYCSCEGDPRTGIFGAATPMVGRAPSKRRCCGVLESAE